MALVKYNNNSISAVTSASSIPSGALTHIKTLTASSSATLSFVHGSGGVDFSTYKEYVFTFKGIHPATDNADFMFNMSVDAGSNYNVAKTTTVTRAYHNEGDSQAALDYVAADDLAQGTGFQQLSQEVGNDNDQTTSGYLHLFNPSSTTFVKHFTSNTNCYNNQNYTLHWLVAGYGNTTSDVDAVQFKMASGNIDAGDICLYGIA